MTAATPLREGADRAAAPAAPVPVPARYPGEFIRLLARDHIALFRRLSEAGDVTTLRLGGVQLVLLSHPEDVKQLLVTDQRAFTKGRALDRVKILLGKGLLTNEGESHLRQRRLVQPAFHRERIAGYAEQMVRHTVRVARRWRHDTTIDVHAEMMRLTLDIAAQTLFSLEVGEDPGGIEEALDLSLRLYRYAVLPLGGLLEYLPIPFVRKTQAARKRLNHWLHDTIARRRADGRDRGDLLSMLLQAQDSADGNGQMSDTQLRDEVVTLLMAGHETTAVALSWAWYLLARHPEVSARLEAELDLVLGGRVPTMADVPRLEYARMVLAETFRLYPPAWIIERLATRDVVMRDHRIPAGALVFASQYFVHRDPRWYADPERFDPERWRAEEVVARPKYSYFPFGGGTRVCVGEQFAWLEGVLILATIAQCWRMTLDQSHPVVLEPLITLRPKQGIQVTLSRR